MSFVRAASPIWYFPDLTGNPLNDTDYLFVLSNVFPYVPVIIYQDPNGTIPWSNPIEALANGTFPINMYFDPNVVYRLEVRAGATQADALINLIENFIPEAGGTPSPPGNIVVSSSNLVSNPQFAQVNFATVPPGTTPSISISAAGTYNIAPGWSLVLTGSGTALITQLIATGAQNTLLNPVPPYALEFNLSGWTSAILEQQFNGLGALFSNSNVSMQVTAFSNDGIAHNISLVYFPQPPGTPVTIASANLSITAYTVIQGAVPIPTSTNTNLSNSSFVDMQIILPTTGIVDISNVQMVQQDTPTPISFQQQPLENQINNLFFNYANELIIKPKNSILTAWNFALNPFQFVTPVVTTQVPITAYIADQTICHQEAASQVQNGKGSSLQRQCLLVKAVGAAATTRFALIQYIDSATIRPYWSYILSSLVRARIFTTHGTSVRIKMRLIYRTTAPTTIGNTEPIASWAANSDPVFAAGWTAIAPLNDPAYILPNTYSTDEGTSAFPAFSFDQFTMPDASTSTMSLGIVIYTMDNMNSSGTADSIGFDKISLVPNKFAVDTNPQTFAECLHDCEYYFEKSLLYNLIPGTANYNGQVFRSQGITTGGGGIYILFAEAFDFNYRVNKQGGTSVINLWSPTTGAQNTIDAIIWYGASANIIAQVATGNWSYASSEKGLQATPTNNNALVTSSGALGSSISAFISFHYTADARLGI